MRLILAILLLPLSLFAGPQQMLLNPLAVAAATSGPTNNTYGLVGWWILDSDYNDSSGNGNNGSAQGGSSLVAAAITNGVSLNGSSQYVDCGNGATLQITSNLTIMSWFKFTGSFQNGVYPRIASKLETSPNYNGYELLISSKNDGIPNTPYFQIGSSGTLHNTRNDPSGTNFTTAISTNTWYHLAGVRQGNYMNLYLNGSLKSSINFTSGGIGSSSMNVQIGSWPGAAGNLFQGLLDDVRIYNRALSATEITNQYRWPPGSGR